MQIIIDISEEMYNFACNYPEKVLAGYPLCIKNGTVLPEGHGRIGDLDKLIKAMKERDEDNGGEPLNAVDRGYHLACRHMVKVAEECIIIEADKAEGEE